MNDVDLIPEKLHAASADLAAHTRLPGFTPLHARTHYRKSRASALILLALLASSAVGYSVRAATTPAPTASGPPSAAVLRTYTRIMTTNTGLTGHISSYSVTTETAKLSDIFCLAVSGLNCSSTSDWMSPPPVSSSQESVPPPVAATKPVLPLCTARPAGYIKYGNEGALTGSTTGDTPQSLYVITLTGTFTPSNLPNMEVNWGPGGSFTATKLTLWIGTNGTFDGFYLSGVQGPSCSS